jgi:hypothetical protein
MYSPHDQLPAVDPKNAKYPIGYFYDKTAKHLLKDTVRVMDNGLHIDLDKVVDLEAVLVEQLQEVDKELANNTLIQAYLGKRYRSQIAAFVKDRKSKMKTPAQYLVPFKYNDVNHRSYFMEEYATLQGWGLPDDKLPTGVGKWSVSLVSKYAKTNKLLQMLLAGTLPLNTALISVAMNKLAEDKAEMYNEKYVRQAREAPIPFPRFNPASPKQKQELFGMLGISSDAVSKDTGLSSWDRAQVERINEETSDDSIKQFTQCFIDHSFAAIIKNNFIEAFYNYSVDDRLYGQYKLLGAKSGRYTSSNPNMLNMPSTKSRFAKAVKECFTAPKGTIILTADYNALEDRVIASLSKDDNKCAIFTDNLDGHSVNAIGYFADKIKELMELVGDTATDATNFYKLVTDGVKWAKELRQWGKGPTFGLAYGAFPPKIAATLKISLEEAQTIFDNYHQILYPGITEYRETYVLPTAKKDGEIHLGLGFTLKTNDADRDIRSLANATCQFWSILTALAISKMHILIDEKGYQDDVKTISTIYDSIYYQVTDDPVIIKWVNDNLIKTMTVDFMKDQTISNEAESDIGYNWSDMVTIPNDASTYSIKRAKVKLRRIARGVE